MGSFHSSKIFSSFLLILFILPAKIAWSQKNSDYSHLYRFQVSSADSSYIQTDSSLKEKEQSSLNGRLVDNNSAPLAFFTVVVTSQGRLNCTLLSNAKGEFQKDLAPGKYEISLSGAGYEMLKVAVQLTAGMKLQLQAIIAKVSSLTWYEIHSLKELSNEEIEEIKHCIKKNLDNPAGCGKKKEYFIMIEI